MPASEHMLRMRARVCVFSSGLSGRFAFFGAFYVGSSAPVRVCDKLLLTACCNRKMIVASTFVY